MRRKTLRDNLLVRVLLIAAIASAHAAIAADSRVGNAAVEIVRRTERDTRRGVHLAYSPHPTGHELIGPAGISANAGQTWKAFAPTPDFAANLPRGYRRDPRPALLDPRSGRIVMVYNA